MTAKPQPEATAEATVDTFTLDSLVDVITFDLSFKHLYGDRKFQFSMRAETEDDTTALREMFAGRKVSDHDWRVERLARLLVKPPTGFDDFPRSGDLAGNARRYFAPKKATRFVMKALARYDTLQTPDQEFFL